MWERFPGALYSPSNMLILDTFLDIYMINWRLNLRGRIMS
jgi:hypothetical protein